jgi:hypothetical protein
VQGYTGNSSGVDFTYLCVVKTSSSDPLDTFIRRCSEIDIVTELIYFFGCRFKGSTTKKSIDKDLTGPVESHPPDLVSILTVVDVAHTKVCPDISVATRLRRHGRQITAV